MLKELLEYTTSAPQVSERFLLDTNCLRFCLLPSQNLVWLVLCLCFLYKTLSIPVSTTDESFGHLWRAQSYLSQGLVRNLDNRMTFNSLRLSPTGFSPIPFQHFSPSCLWLCDCVPCLWLTFLPFHYIYFVFIPVRKQAFLGGLVLLSELLPIPLPIRSLEVCLMKYQRT